MNNNALRFLLPMLAACFLTSPAQASSLTALEILQQFNLVVLGSATSTSHVDGRAYIGGSLAGGDYVQHAGETPLSNYAGLTVAGSATNLKVNGLGAVVQGNLDSATVNSGSSVVVGMATNTSFNGTAYVGVDGGGNTFNGGTDATLINGTAATAATSTGFGTVLSDLSTQLQSLTSNSSYTVSGNKVTFTATAGSDGIAVFDITDSSIFTSAITEYAFNVDSNVSTIIINASADTATLAANFLGGSAATLGSKILWNFYNATSLTINSQFGGSLLAVNAALTTYQNVEGGVYVQSLIQGGEIHLQSFTGTLPEASSAPVPEPSTALLLGSGMAALAGMTRKTRRGQGKETGKKPCHDCPSA